jgi:integrase
MATLRAIDTVGARALELAILTGGRTREILGARWSEIDFEQKVWTIPAERMTRKGGRRRAHEVPLSAAALAVLSKLREVRESDVVFPGDRGPIINRDAMNRVAKSIRPDIVPHGFRSTFRDWAGDHTNFPREVLEEALAHVVGNETERAYRRLAALEKRRKLMDAWAAWCGRRPGEVVEMKRAR